ncbi:DUF554 domain-containing protein [Alkaliphilus peptidifermentans]|uniref:Membrane protein YdfK n=1 Tax=Alkaliphilus peptidifermentans DSM 18978 TaxID=1120976 RepID=A0A1G5IAK6_9FIRM|nr:DUF554 domain-containing protein [Alkaliphilus peptidifermentans]SCY73185.1 hypothetical protein SAMN03080606_02316 [Alkaliphilus peptidifermentans DSM 18978]
MLGTIVNAVAIIIGGLTGILLRKGIPDSFKNTIMQGLGLCVFIIGLSGALKSENIILVIFCIVIGSIIGEAFAIEDKLQKVGDWLEGNVGRGGEGSMAKGFVTASLIYCVGAMAIVGSLESGLTGNHETLFAKSLIDGITAVIFASTLGIGVVFSSIAVFVYQGIITFSASFVKPFLVAEVIREMSAIGGLLIMGIAINILDIKKISVGNMLPAVFLPIFYPFIEPFLIRVISFFEMLL